MSNGWFSSAGMISAIGSVEPGSAGGAAGGGSVQFAGM